MPTTRFRAPWSYLRSGSRVQRHTPRSRRLRDVTGHRRRHCAEDRRSGGQRVVGRADPGGPNSRSRALWAQDMRALNGVILIGDSEQGPPALRVRVSLPAALLASKHRHGPILARLRGILLELATSRKGGAAVGEKEHHRGSGRCVSTGTLGRPGITGAPGGRHSCGRPLHAPPGHVHELGREPSYQAHRAQGRGLGRHACGQHAA